MALDASHMPEPDCPLVDKHVCVITLAQACKARQSSGYVYTQYHNIQPGLGSGGDFKSPRGAVTYGNPQRRTPRHSLFTWPATEIHSVTACACSTVVRYVAPNTAH